MCVGQGAAVRCGMREASGRGAVAAGTCGEAAAGCAVRCVGRGEAAWQQVRGARRGGLAAGTSTHFAQLLELLQAAHGEGRLLDEGLPTAVGHHAPATHITLHVT